MNWFDVILCGFLFGIGFVTATGAALFLNAYLNRVEDWYDHRRSTRYTRR